MKIETRSVRIRSAVKFVLRRIPTKDRKIIESIVNRIISSKKWSSRGMDDDFERSPAVLYPLFLNMDKESFEKKDYVAQVIYYLPICKLCSDKCLIGITAHELAHALRASKLGLDWQTKMLKMERKEEQLANRISCQWGFGEHIKTMLKERKKVQSILENKAIKIKKLISDKVSRDNVMPSGWNLPIQ